MVITNNQYVKLERFILDNVINYEYDGQGFNSATFIIPDLDMKITAVVSGNVIVSISSNGKQYTPVNIPGYVWRKIDHPSMLNDMMDNIIYDIEQIELGKIYDELEEGA